MQPKYWAFISYSHADKKWAAWLHHQVETYRVPAKLVGRETGRGHTVPKRPYPAFRDREELPSSANLGQNIAQALQDSAYLVVICSPRAAASRWVNEEVITFKLLGGEDRILAFIVDGEPHATDKPECGLLECFPPALRHRIGPNRELLPLVMEPIAADARRHADGKARARLKLLAGILGVDFDELVQRDAQRRRRNLVRLFLVFATLCVAAGAFIYYEEKNYALAHAQLLMEKKLEADDRARTAAAQQQVVTETQKRQAQATEFHQQSQLKYAGQALEKGRGLFLAGNYGQALPYLAASWNIKADPAGLRIMINETLRNLQSTPFSGPVFSYGLDGGTFTPDGQSVMVWSVLDRSLRVVPVDSPVHPQSIDIASASHFGVVDVAFADDGKTAFVARGETHQNKLGVFDLATGNLTHDFNLPAEPVKVQLTHDQAHVIVALKGGRIVVLDRNTGAISLEFPAIETKGFDINQLILSPGDKYLAVTISTMTSIVAFDFATGKQLWSSPGTGFLSPVAAFSPDGRLFLMGQTGGADILDPVTGPEHPQAHLDMGLKTFCPLLTSCAFSPDGGAAVFGSNNGRAFLDHFSSGTVVPLPSEAGTVPITSFSHDGKKVLTGQRAIYVWDGADGHLIYHSAAFPDLLKFGAFSPDGSLVAAGTQAGQFGLIRTDQAGAESRVASTAPSVPILFSAQQLAQPETGQVLSLDPGNALTLHNSDGTTLPLADVPAATVAVTRFSPKGTALGVGFADGSFGAWSTTDGHRLYWNNTLSNAAGLAWLTLSDAEISTLHWDGTIATADFTTGQTVGSIKDAAFANADSSLDWSGGKLLACDGKSTCRIFAGVNDPHPVTITSADPIGIARLSPDGKWLATGTAGGSVNLWSTDTGQPGPALASHPEGAVKLLAWSPTGKYLLNAGASDELYLSDATTGQALLDFGKLNQVQDACFAQGDKLVLIALYNGTVILGDATANQGVALWQTPGDSLGHVAANAAGTRFYANGMSRVYEWSVAPDVDPAALSAAVGRSPWTLDNLDLRPR